MTYYEELGVARAAPVEEIRHAYRRLARLVHPDQCADPETRRLAELQMKRLNAILAQLADAERRARYDASLSRGDGGPPPWNRAMPRRREMAYAGVAVVALLCLAEGSRPWRPQVPAAPAATQTPLPESRPGGLHRKPAAPPGRAAAAAPRRPAAASLPEVPEVAPPGTVVADPLPAALEPVVTVAMPTEAPQSTAPPPPRLEGRWFFVASPGLRFAGYAPEYVELRLREDGGVLHGLYQARYRVSDRAISPNVAFRFEGRAGPEGGILPWQGPGGSQGEVTLKLLPAGSLEVDWVAHQLGRELGLVSGTATLVRKLE